MNGHPVSGLFNDPFYSSRDGRGESEHVFLAGNGLPERWAGRREFCVGELGFGTGLNFLVTWQRWIETRKPGQTLSFTSFEGFPLPRAAMERALANWPDLSGLAARLLAVWDERGGTWHLDDQTVLHVIAGDARETLPAWEGAADAWYLDGFSPAKNPQMWEAELMAAVAAHTCPDGTFATYTAAGWVRRNLQAAGFHVEKCKGFAGKRDMSRGHLEAETDVS